MSNELKSPVAHGTHAQTIAGAVSNADRWPNQLNPGMLLQHAEKSNPMGAGLDCTRRSTPSISTPRLPTSRR